MTDRSHLLMIVGGRSLGRQVALALVACVAQSHSVQPYLSEPSLAFSRLGRKADPAFRLVNVRKPPKAEWGRIHDSRLLATRPRRYDQR